MDKKSKKLFELLLAAEKENAECRENPDIFFPEDWDHWRDYLDRQKGGHTGMSAKARNLAKEMCMRCPLRSQCLDYALEAKEPAGIWGGLTAFERMSLQQNTRR